MQDKWNACKGILMGREVLSGYRADLDGSNSYREAIEKTKTFSMDREAIEIAIKRSRRAR